MSGTDAVVVTATTAVVSWDAGYVAGWEARRRRLAGGGRRRPTNPYPPGSPAHEGWDAGFAERLAELVAESGFPVG